MNSNRQSGKNQSDYNILSCLDTVIPGAHAQLVLGFSLDRSPLRTSASCNRVPMTMTDGHMPFFSQLGSLDDRLHVDGILIK
jgi:hypothetical protein